MAERRFTESQVADIIRRAADNQARASRIPHQPATGISEAEVRRIAQELGIEAGALQEALDGAGVWRSSDSGTLRSVERTLERVFDGEVPEDAYSLITDEFLPVGNAFTPSLKIGNALSYTSMAGMAQCTVSVARRNGKTSLKVRSNAGLAVLPTFLPALIAFVVSGALVWEEMHAPGLTKALVHGLITLAAFTGAALWFRTLVRNSNRKVGELLDRAARALSESVPALRGRLESSAPAGVEQPYVDDALRENLT